MKVKTLLLLLVLSSPVYAHSDGEQVYDHICCHDKDCAPVLSMKPSEDGNATLMTTKHGTALVTNSLSHERRRKAKDGRFHVCMRAPMAGELPDGTPYMVPICVYFPDQY